MNAATQVEWADGPMIYFPEIVTLGDVPRVHGRRTPEAPAFRFEDEQIDWAECDLRASRVARALREAGVGIGDRIAYLGKNSLAYFELLFGACRVGAVMVPINWRLAPPEVRQILDDCGAALLFVDETGAATAAALPGSSAPTPDLISIQPVEGLPVFREWRDAWAEADWPPPGKADDVAIQLYTSGTTGLPKGVQLSHRAFYAFNAHAAEHPEEFGPEFEWNSWSAADVALVALPVFHISGSGWGIVAAYAGAFTIVLREFDHSMVIEAIRRFKVSKTVLVPQTIQAILDLPELRPEDFASMRNFMYGAAPISPQLLERAVAAFDCGFVQMYGLTETCGGVSCLAPADHRPELARMRSAGRPLPGVGVRIVEPGSDAPRAIGEVGEICVRTPAAMNGYWRKPEETARIIAGDGWVRTGDAGYLDEDGFLFITDRVKDMIVSGGENIYPAEVEAALATHPEVLEVAVIGVPDARWGEAVKAVVAPRPGCAPDAAALIAHARQLIAGYKLPKSVDFVAALPRNATGKVMKHVLREPYWHDRVRRVN